MKKLLRSKSSIAIGAALLMSIIPVMPVIAATQPVSYTCKSTDNKSLNSAPAEPKFYCDGAPIIYRHGYIAVGKGGFWGVTGFWVAPTLKRAPIDVTLDYRNSYMFVMNITILLQAINHHVVTNSPYDFHGYKLSISNYNRDWIASPYSIPGSEYGQYSFNMFSRYKGVGGNPNTLLTQYQVVYATNRVTGKTTYSVKVAAGATTN